MKKGKRKPKTFFKCVQAATIWARRNRVGLLPALGFLIGFMEEDHAKDSFALSELLDICVCIEDTGFTGAIEMGAKLKGDLNRAEETREAAAADNDAVVGQAEPTAIRRSSRAFRQSRERPGSNPTPQRSKWRWEGEPSQPSEGEA